jgi:hypothetical protein
MKVAFAVLLVALPRVNMVRIIAAFVETPYYVAAAALLSFVAVFWFALKHEKTLLLPFIVATALVIAVSTAFRFFPMFFISIPSMMVGLTIHLFIAALVSYPIRRLILRR